MAPPVMRRRTLPRDTVPYSPPPHSRIEDIFLPFPSPIEEPSVSRAIDRKITMAKESESSKRVTAKCSEQGRVSIPARAIDCVPCGADVSDAKRTAMSDSSPDSDEAWASARKWVRLYGLLLVYTSIAECVNNRVVFVRIVHRASA